MSALVKTHPAETLMHAEAASQPHVNWWWDYASLEAPDHNEIYYFKFTLLSIGYFFAMHLAVHLIAMRKTQIYRDMKAEKRTEYRSYVTSPIHAIGAVVLSTLSMWFICGDGQTVFNSDECM